MITVGAVLVSLSVALQTQANKAQASSTEPRGAAAEGSVPGAHPKPQAIKVQAHQAEVSQRCRQNAADAPARGVSFHEPALADWMTMAVTTDLARRRAIVAYFREHPKEAGPCAQLLLKQLASLRAALRDGTYTKDAASLRPFVLLAAAAGLPEGHQTLSDLVTFDASADWIIALRSFDVQQYERVLGLWTEKTAAAARKDLGLELRSADLYGQIQGNVFVDKSMASADPLLFNAYLGVLVDRVASEGAAKVLDSTTLSRLNVLYATMGLQHRSATGDIFARLILERESMWISSLRLEPGWVQYRLLALARRFRGPETTRELMWIADHHGDLQMRSQAAAILDELVTAVPRAGQKRSSSEFR